MQTQMQRAQSRHDNMLPPDDSWSDRTISEWVAEAVDSLILGNDILFKRDMHSEQGVTYAQFALAVDEHVNARLADCKINTPALGYLILGGISGSKTRSQAEELIGYSDHPYGMRGQIAERLLKPLAKDGLAAQMEDEEL
ncbi:hypothetical protein [Pseudomonas sp. CCC4.4]|uniref:hypothetical protein n=1 Tax=Pseudomonas sp. CCC4.4 TaxID=3048612 RepID=UPI002B23B9C8|nr:hypothetical protein [Pseudomonas sp. CCC4.4]MEB0170055.1 hypothetical protein [Pseudomonas sp. CCC4.4]